MYLLVRNDQTLNRQAPERTSWQFMSHVKTHRIFRDKQDFRRTVRAEAKARLDAKPQATVVRKEIHEAFKSYDFSLNFYIAQRRSVEAPKKACRLAGQTTLEQHVERSNRCYYAICKLSLVRLKVASQHESSRCSTA